MLCDDDDGGGCGWVWGIDVLYGCGCGFGGGKEVTVVDGWLRGLEGGGEVLGEVLVECVEIEGFWFLFKGRNISPVGLGDLF